MVPDLSFEFAPEESGSFQGAGSPEPTVLAWRTAEDWGEVRRLVGELRGTLASLLAYSKELGLTPASRAALGLNVARGRALTLAAAMEDEETD